MNRRILKGMAAAVFFICLSSFAFISYTTKKTIDDIWKQLGLNEKDARLNISQSFSQGYIFIYGAKNAKNIAIGNRAAVAADLLNYTKQYISSPAFAGEYRQYRENLKPQSPEPMKTKESIREKFIKDAEEGIRNIEKVIAATTDPGVKKTLGDQIPIQKKQLEDYKSPGSKMIEAAWQGEQNNYRWRNEEYLQSLKKWETDYPESSTQLVKARLAKFLEVTKDVDYDAALTERNGKKYFVNPRYEAQSPHWKMAFRAGKEVTETARAFAQQWLKELN